MTDFIRSACLTSYPEVARSVGLDPMRMLRDAGIDHRCLSEPEIKVSAAALRRLLEASAKASGLEDFGLRIAETRSLSILGPIGLLVREEPTVRDALNSLTRYIPLHNESLDLRLEEHDGTAIISVALRVRRLVALRQGTELTVGVLYRIVQSLIGPHWRPLVCFAHETPRRRITHHRLFGGRVEFGHDFNGIVCQTCDLDRRIPTADPALARYARQHLDSLLARPHMRFSDKTRELISLQLASGRCTVDLVAGQLSVNRRLLHRRLAEEGLTFSDIVEGVRTEIVTRTLSNPGKPMSALADMAGFSSLSAFSRWFRDRFGTTPTAWRRDAATRGDEGHIR